MHHCNFKEWEALRREIETIRKCITNYMGLIFGGVGIAFVTMGGRAQELLAADAGDSTVPLGVAALALSIVISTVLSISTYKFLSHNRYSGYCKLLTHERIEFERDDAVNKCEQPTDVLAWEVCMDRVREADFGPGHYRWLEYCRATNMSLLTGVDVDELRRKIAEVGGPSPESDKESFVGGLRVLVHGFMGKNESTSWGFALYVMMAYVVLWILVVAAGWWLVVRSPVPPEVGQVVIASFVTFLGIVSWIGNIGRLWNVMKGSRTVDAFCWKFLRSSASA